MQTVACRPEPRPPTSTPILHRHNFFITQTEMNDVLVHSIQVVPSQWVIFVGLIPLHLMHTMRPARQARPRSNDSTQPDNQLLVPFGGHMWCLAILPLDNLAWTAGAEPCSQIFCCQHKLNFVPHHESSSYARRLPSRPVHFNSHEYDHIYTPSCNMCTYSMRSL